MKRGIGGGAGLIFKGSGFYITDYRSEGYKASAKADSTTKPSGAGETKPAGEGKSSESKPTESKPSVEAKPVVPAAKPTAPAPKARGGTPGK